MVKSFLQGSIVEKNIMNNIKLTGQFLSDYDNWKEENELILKNHKIRSKISTPAFFGLIYMFLLKDINLRIDEGDLYFHDNEDLDFIISEYNHNNLTILDNDRIIGMGFYNYNNIEFQYIINPNIKLIPINNGREGYYLYNQNNLYSRILYLNQLSNIISKITGENLIVMVNKKIELPSNIDSYLNYKNLSQNVDNDIFEFIDETVDNKLKNVISKNSDLKKLKNKNCYYYLSGGKIKLFYFDKLNYFDLSSFSI